MKMKKSIISLALLPLALGFTACDLDYEPENTLVAEKVFKDIYTAQAALDGAYVRLNVMVSGAPQDQNNYANFAYIYPLGDIGTENLQAAATSTDFRAFETGEYTDAVHENALAQMWRIGYNAIDMANNVIVGVQEFAKFDPAEKERLINEAKFIRAYCYFSLLCPFGDKALLGNDQGDGLVLRLEPYNGYNPDHPEGRSSNAVIWKQIIDDLTAALSLPDAVPDASNRVRACKSTAQALLSRVYLYKGTYTNNAAELTRARDLAHEVLLNPAYQFTAAPSELTDMLFPPNTYTSEGGYPDPTQHSNELIFFEPSRIYTASYPNGLSYFNKSSYYLTQAVQNIYDPDDVRRSVLIGQGSDQNKPSDKTSLKYSTHQYDDVIYIRLSEVKLTYAEALTRLSNAVSTEAIQQVNDIRLRAYPEGDKPAAYTAADFAGADDLLRAILTERRKELAFEGHYRWDLMRTNNFLGDATLGAMAPDRWNIPVPDYEIRLTHNVIKQNTGYAQ